MPQELESVEEQKEGGLPYIIQLVAPDSNTYQHVLATAALLDQARYISAPPNMLARSMVLGPSSIRTVSVFYAS